MKKRERNTGIRKRGREQFKHAPNRFLIVCEGKKTEPNYFNEIRKEKRIPEEIIVIKGPGYTPKKLVEYAKIIKENNDRYKEPFNQVWCVFDRDDHLFLNEAIQQAEANGFNVAFSNPSFELWFLLHFTDQNASIHRTIVDKKLKEYIPNYTKSMNVYSLIKSRQDEAINRAKVLRKMHESNKNEITCNPSTSVDKLVENLV